MKLYKVKSGSLLGWPTEVHQRDVTRGIAGYVVDLDAPFEKEWCAGQEWKLEPAPEATEASPITNPLALKALRAEAKRVAALEPAPASDTEQAPAASPASVAPAAAATNDDDLRVTRPQKPAKPAAKAS